MADNERGRVRGMKGRKNEGQRDRLLNRDKKRGKIYMTKKIRERGRLEEYQSMILSNSTRKLAQNIAPYGLDFCLFIRKYL